MRVTVRGKTGPTAGASFVLSHGNRGLVPESRPGKSLPMSLEQQITRQGGFSLRGSHKFADVGMAIVKERNVRENEAVAALLCNEVVRPSSSDKYWSPDGASSVGSLSRSQMAGEDVPAGDELHAALVSHNDLSRVDEWEISRSESDGDGVHSAADLNPLVSDRATPKGLSHLQHNHRFVCKRSISPRVGGKVIAG